MRNLEQTWRKALTTCDYHGLGSQGSCFLDGANRFVNAANTLKLAPALLVEEVVEEESVRDHIVST